MNETVDVFVLIEEGKEPVCIKRPTELEGKDLNDLLVAKGILHTKADSAEIKEPIGGFLKDATIVVDAFYFIDKGPFLMMFDMGTKTKDKSGNEVGVVAGLTGDSELEQLFHVTAASTRVLCCTKGSFEILRRYAAELSAQKTDV
jgi:hypothetical protein